MLRLSIAFLSSIILVGCSQSESASQSKKVNEPIHNSINETQSQSSLGANNVSFILQAEDAEIYGAEIADVNGHQVINYFEEGDYLLFKSQDFGTGVNRLTLRFAQEHSGPSSRISIDRPLCS